MFALRICMPSGALIWHDEDTVPYECDGLTAYRQRPLVVALPETEAQVAAVLKACLALGVPVVARGAGTGLSGAMPNAMGVTLSLAKFNRSRCAACFPRRSRPRCPCHGRPGNGPRAPTRARCLMLAGCVQPAMAPHVNSATARVLDAAGIETVIAPGAGCCGAVKCHLNDHEDGKAQMRANIDAWWPLVEREEVEAIVMNASGCGVTVREYGHMLKGDAAYLEKAERISAFTRDLSELLPELVPLKGRVRASRGVIAYHPPCTLQHGQKLRGGVLRNLRALGFDEQVTLNESHLCYGSAGTYPVLQPELAYPLRDRKLGHLNQFRPTTIVSANIGCITHLQSGSETPVRHWVDLLDEALAA
ncbi:glycolate oxidase subunit GlcF [Variovorax sp. J31P207]|uniref:glycolate oxidase subunit GlcF n=1 Tax=Variovorax sp. J31P207 TaxID=3053510 RepID=UPI0025774032|nr:glycolate oxidase subunit GlcF [Variovorax sp. J31P207]MDM0065268.1 glycolate oxidase subunit GlcF [Variovorax sp. J31P207]